MRKEEEKREEFVQAATFYFIVQLGVELDPTRGYSA
jgi:hypothetical protein